ncbi:hypothetical protein PFISCL1PPCAC_22946 [Pristionchus fissidentatus]|uniref:BTB domain-containing protein n=1 Tax=Pristionchus fissidentatus TaxID=1538716 RepID=A0AAV5WLN7_9BILA|nr:hypothetical protein PFISCL1PPCAC_22946 [Pristionchus fissidentatus]
MTFNHEAFSWGFRNYLKWDTLMDPELGLVNDDKMDIEVRLMIQKTCGVRRPLKFDFTDAHDQRHDVTLVIEGKKLYVSKQLLALNSPVFNTMFYEEFEEKNKKEIELKDVEYGAFIDLLHVIYPCQHPVNEATVKNVLSLGDRFDIKTAVDLAERFLITGDSRLSNAEKLLLSDQFRLFKLQDRCLSKLLSHSDVKKLKTSEEYKALSETTKVALLEKMIKLTD